MRYRSKPQEVEAIQWTGDNVDEVFSFGATLSEMHDPIWSGTEGDASRRVLGSYPNGHIELLAGKDGAQGWVPVPVGHWIVRQPGDVTDHWPVDPYYFAGKYEPVEEPA